MSADLGNYNIIRYGRLVSFDKDTQLSVVRISHDQQTSDIYTNERVVPFMLLEDVPTHVPSGGGWSMTFDYQPGDTCLILFSQLGYDHWLYDDADKADTFSDGSQMPWMKRRFNLNDGFCMIGFNTIPRAIKNYSVDGSQWRDSEAKQHIHLKADGTITVKSDVSIHLIQM